MTSVLEAARRGMDETASFDSAHPLERFMAWESVNSYPRLRDGSTVDQRYLAAPGRRFRVKVIEIPFQDLHVLDSDLGDRAARAFVFSGDGPGRRFRFLVHPESEGLYADLITRYGVASTCEVTPTASPRTVLVRDWNVFAKLTLDRIHDGLGRAIPDWEVRRAVAITRLAQSIPEDEMRRYGVRLIPEIIGGYVDEGQGLASYVDRSQGVVFQHGMLYRPTAFIGEHPGKDLYPGFALFSAREGRPPLIVEWWRRQRSHTFLGFADFVDQTLIEPVVRALGYLVFAQGLIPDSHLQNLVFAVDPATDRVSSVLLRDMGSIKVNLELRWSRGLPVESLGGPSAAWDFKYEWGTEMSRRPFYQWFNRYAFSDEFGFGRVLRLHVPDYGPMAMARRVDTRVRESLAHHFPEAFRTHGSTVRSCLLRHLDLHPPAVPEPPTTLTDEAPRLHDFALRQEARGQTIPLRPGWERGPSPSITEYGVVYSSSTGPRLALRSNRDLPDEGEDEPEPSHFETEVPLDEILGAKRLRHSPPRNRTENQAPPEGTEMPTALRIGSPTAPAYYIVEGAESIRRALTANTRTARVEVLQNWVALPRPKQRRLLWLFRRVYEAFGASVPPPATSSSS